MVEAPIFQGVIKLRNVLDCQAKILEAVMDQRQCGFVYIIFIIFRTLFQLIEGHFDREIVASWGMRG
jgi:hypothetical protein